MIAQGSLQLVALQQSKDTVYGRVTCSGPIFAQWELYPFYEAKG